MQRKAHSWLKRRMRMRDTYVLPRKTEKKNAAIKIQRWIKYKLWLKRPRESLSMKIIKIQKVIRGFLGRRESKRTEEEFKNFVASVIQEQWRKYRFEKNLILEENKETCLICMETIGIFNTFKMKCDHKMCIQCTREMISHAILNAQTEIPIKCPLFTENCETILSCTDDNVLTLCSLEEHRKWEYWEIMKTAIPSNCIAYCPFPDCGMPYDSSLYIDMSNTEITQDNDPYKYRILCPECMSLMCVRCKNIWEPNHMCPMTLEERTNADKSTSLYLDQHCKLCPGCNAIVEKTQTNDQIEHEKKTKLSGGTEDCHHIECTNCKKHFCWTCLKGYDNRIYYHKDCPISDCEITFINDIPQITRLPHGINEINIQTIDISNNKKVIKTEWYSTNGHKQTERKLDNPIDNIVYVECTSEGVVLTLRGKMGKYTYRQNNKRYDNIKREIHDVYQNSTLMDINNRYRNLMRNNNINAVLENNRIIPDRNVVIANNTPRPLGLNDNGNRRGGFALPNNNNNVLQRQPLPAPVPPRLPDIPDRRTGPHSAAELLNRYNNRNNNR